MSENIENNKKEEINMEDRLTGGYYIDPACRDRIGIQKLCSATGVYYDEIEQQSDAGGSSKIFDNLIKFLGNLEIGQATKMIDDLVQPYFLEKFSDRLSFIIYIINSVCELNLGVLLKLKDKYQSHQCIYLNEKKGTIGYDEDDKPVPIAWDVSFYVAKYEFQSTFADLDQLGYIIKKIYMDIRKSFEYQVEQASLSPHKEQVDVNGQPMF